jgi:lysozyme
MINKPKNPQPVLEFKKSIRNIVFNDLQRFEGLRLKPYKCSAGKLTIGYGRNLEDRGISEAEANMLLAEDYDNCYKLAERLVKPEDHPASAMVVLVEMIFQLGFEGTRLFKRFLAAINKKDYKLASLEIKSSTWAEQTPNRVKYLASLLERL